LPEPGDCHLNRIPLTPPALRRVVHPSAVITPDRRHIALLSFKVEGRILIPRPSHRQDVLRLAERALYVPRRIGPMYGMHALPSLPRYADYNAINEPDRLKAIDLTGSISSNRWDGDVRRRISPAKGLPDPVTLDISRCYSLRGYRANLQIDPQSSSVVSRLACNLPTNPAMWIQGRHITAASPPFQDVLMNTWEVEHRQVSESSLDLVRESANIFQLPPHCPTPVRTLDVKLARS